MKSKILLALLAVSSMAFAKALDTPARAEKVQDYLQKSVLKIQGVNGIGIGGCNPRTGAEDLDHNFVHCIVIYTETVQAEKKMLGLYPTGTAIRGVFVTIKRIGKVVPQPRMSVSG